MKSILFKTRKDAEHYISDTYGYETLENTLVDVEKFNEQDFDGWVTGETQCYKLPDGRYIGWWESGDDLYEIRLSGEVFVTADNIFDARRLAKEALVIAENNAEEDEDPAVVTLTVNGEECDI